MRACRRADQMKAATHRWLFSFWGRTSCAMLSHEMGMGFHMENGYPQAGFHGIRNPDMKRYPSLGPHTLGLLLLACSPFLFPVAQAACKDRYFAPEDVENAHPLKQPHTEFIAIERAAVAGDASAIRSLAAAYDAGYLVSKCPEKAAKWYGRAANSGDSIARRWMETNEAIAKLSAGPECIGAYCSDKGDRPAHIATFYAGPNGHYFAPLTINGVTVTGLIDTGASAIAISQESARAFGIDKLPATGGIASTANGNVTTTNVVVASVTVSGITLRDVRVSIGISGPPLIGMSFLGRLRMRMAEGTLTMSR